MAKTENGGIPILVAERLPILNDDSVKGKKHDDRRGHVVSGPQTASKYNVPAPAHSKGK